MLTADLGGPDGRRLLRSLRRLGDADRATLLAFAEFLVARADGRVVEPAPADAAAAPAAPGAPPPMPPPTPRPLPEPRPPEESVVAAIRRLRRVYPMLDGAALLTETSTLMGAHLMQGRPAAAVIDDLEVLFAARWRALADGPSPDDAGRA